MPSDEYRGQFFSTNNIKTISIMDIIHDRKRLFFSNEVKKHINRNCDSSFRKDGDHMDNKSIQEQIAASLQTKLTTEYGLDDVKVEPCITHKNNNTAMETVRIRNSSDGIAPQMYIDESISKIQSGIVSIEDVADQLAIAYINAPNEEMRAVAANLDFASARARLFCEVINYEQNRNMLEECPYKQIEDLAVIARYRVSDDGTFIVKNNVLDQMGLSSGEVIDIAIKNSIQDGYSIKPMIEVLQELMGPIDPVMADAMGVDPGLYVVTNEDKVYGAAGVYIDRNLRAEIREIVGGDYFCIPASVHESLIVRDDGNVDYMTLQSMITEVNTSTVAQEDRLSDRPYFVDQSLRIRVCNEETMGQKIADALPPETHHRSISI